MTDQGSASTAHDEEMLDSLTVGRRIRQLRTDRGLTLDDLGAALGRAASQVSVIENGKRELKLGELQKLARILSVSMDDLLSPDAPSRRAGLETTLPSFPRRREFILAGVAVLLMALEDLDPRLREDDGGGVGTTEEGRG